MKMKIEVEWFVKPKSGLTQIDISDLDCNSEGEWENLSEDEQRKRINRYLLTSETEFTAIAETW